MKRAVQGYIATVLHYFEPRPTTNQSILYEFFSLPSLTADATNVWLANETPLFRFLELQGVNPKTDTFPPPLQCVLVSSNSSPGFGPACTQEELITAACPDLLPLGALCVSPPLPPDAVLLAQSIVPMSRWNGRGREARLVDLHTSESEYTFLLLDAAELDMETSPAQSIPDLKPRVFLRDLHKCYVGFHAIRQKGNTRISAPIWGAGSYGADPIVKTLILVMAGALAGITIQLAVDETRSCYSNVEGTDHNLLQLLRALQTRCLSMTVHQLWLFLSSESVQNLPDGTAIAHQLMS